MDNNLLDDHISGNYGEEKSYAYANFWARFFARLIDGVVLFVCGLIVGFVLLATRQPYGQLLMIIVGLLYQPLMEYNYGATLGKMALSLRVVNYDYQRLTLEQSFLRSVFYISSYIHSLIINISFLIGYKIGPVAGISEIFKTDKYFETYGLFAYLSVIIGLTILMSCMFVAFDERRQALHDKIAKTYCIAEQR